MITYCVRQKKKTECVPGSERVKIAKNGRQMLVCTCAECGLTKTQFMSLDKMRMDLISDTIKRNTEIRKIKEDIYSRKNKMTDYEKDEIKSQLEALARRKRSNVADFGEIDRILKRRLQMPDLSEFKQRPDLDQKIQSLIKKMPQKPKRLQMPDLTEFKQRPDLDQKIQSLIKKMPQKPKRLQMPDLTEFKQRPDLDQNYQTVIDKMLQSRYNKLVKNM